MDLRNPTDLLRRARRLFVIGTRIEAYFVIHALALGAATRGSAYLDLYPGAPGVILFAACLLAVAMAGAKILDALRWERAARTRPCTRRDEPAAGDDHQG